MYIEYVYIAFLISPSVTVAGLKRIDNELRKVDCSLSWNEAELCDDGIHIEAQYPNNYDFTQFEKIEGLKIDYDAMSTWDYDVVE